MHQVMAKGNSKTIHKLKRILKEAEKDGEYRVATRIRAIILNIDQRSSGDIARILHVDRTRIPVWINNWNLHGEEGLLEGHRSGRTRELNSEMENQLKDIIESGPVAYGLNTGIWNSNIVAQIINEEFDIIYHPGHVRKILRKIGFSVQRPTIRLINAEEKTKNRWIRYTLPNLKKKQKKMVALSFTKTKLHSGKTQRFIKHGQPLESNP